MRLSIFLTLAVALAARLGQAAPAPADAAAAPAAPVDPSQADTPSPSDATSKVSPASVNSFDGDKVPGGYIVVLKDGVDKAAFVEQVRDKVLSSDPSGDSKLIYTGWDKDTINAVSGKFSPDVLEKLKAVAGIDYIEEDGIMKSSVLLRQTNAPWGLSRLSQPQRLTNQNAAALTFNYTFDSASGAGVDVYVVDTGINTQHTQFGGRATLGAVFGSSANADGNGHGTHVAGTVGGITFGVSKNVSLVAVKVLSDDGSGSVSDIISGLNFVRTQQARTRRPTVVNMSLGGGAAPSLDSAVRNLITAGIHVIIAAGNDNVDASTESPARVTQAITVAASTIADAKASFSNFGSVVDIFAPGQQIISAWIGSTTAVKSLSGTSMATPHVAGLVAYLISREGNRTPAAMATRLTALGVKGVLSGVPSGTPNILARNDV